MDEIRTSLPTLRTATLDRSNADRTFRYTAYLDRGELRYLRVEAVETSGAESEDQAYFEHDSLIALSSIQGVARPHQPPMPVETELRFDANGRLLFSRMRREDGKEARMAPNHAAWLRRYFHTIGRDVLEDVGGE